MKKIIIGSLLFLGTTSLFADTTMCFKENHPSMSTIESTPLDGGECNGAKTIQDMKNDGWSTDDIKVTPTASGMNFIYIFKKGGSDTFSTATTKESIRENYAKIKAEEEREKKIKKETAQLEHGKKYYIKKCQNCHGQKGEKKAYGTSAPLKDLSAKEMTLAITDYQLFGKNNGNGQIMTAISNSISQNDIEDIEIYLKSIN